MELLENWQAIFICIVCIKKLVTLYARIAPAGIGYTTVTYIVIKYTLRLNIN